MALLQVVVAVVVVERLKATLVGLSFMNNIQKVAVVVAEGVAALTLTQQAALADQAGTGRSAHRVGWEA
jgi:hypothetical protein